MVNPMIRMKIPRIGHDQEIEIGPPLLKPAPKLVKQPARIEMIENEIAKLEKPDQDRFRSCEYPSFARCFSSSDSVAALSALMKNPWARSDHAVGQARPVFVGPSILHAKKGLNSDH